MHLLFLHQNFPAQFAPIATHLAAQPGYRVTFVSNTGEGSIPGVERIAYKPGGGATARTHYCSRTFENVVWQSQGVVDALKARPDIQPDLIIGHSGFVSTLPLRERFNAPQINYFEYFYHTVGSDLDFRPDERADEIDRIRARFRNAALLLDLDNCNAGYCPTQWQRSRFPERYRTKLDAIFDGIDTVQWSPRPRSPRQAGRFVVPDNIKLVTYVARGFESIRGFDIFMKVAKKLYQHRSDVRFLVVGQDRICYGGDLKRTGGRSFKDWVLAQDSYDLSKFAFVGKVSPEVLAQVFSIGDLHIYLTVPFVLSWSLMNALACGATVLASRTAPVCEMIEHGRNGLLNDFFDIDGFVDQANKVLDDLAAFRPLGLAGVEFIRSQYSLDVCLPQIRALFNRVVSKPVPVPVGE